MPFSYRVVCLQYFFYGDRILANMPIFFSLRNYFKERTHEVYDFLDTWTINWN